MKRNVYFLPDYGLNTIHELLEAGERLDAGVRPRKLSQADKDFRAIHRKFQNVHETYEETLELIREQEVRLTRFRTKAEGV